MKWWAAVLVMCASRGEAADLRTEALQAIFPGMDVVATTRHRDDASRGIVMEYPDAFAAQPIFQVNGAAANAIERCASDGSTSREVRLIVFDWPRTRVDLLAVVQYRFIGAMPANVCPTIGMIVHLSRRGAVWQVLERRLVEPDHHWAFAAVNLADVTEDGVAELLVETQLGGGGGTGTLLQIFDLSGRSLRQILATDSRADTPGDRYSQVLDVARSSASSGRSVCFELTVFVRGGRVYSKPRVSQECYPRGMGVDEKQARSINRGLRP
jgi:hypothetical protein